MIIFTEEDCDSAIESEKVGVEKLSGLKRWGALVSIFFVRSSQKRIFTTIPHAKIDFMSLINLIEIGRAHV